MLRFLLFEGPALSENCNRPEQNRTRDAKVDAVNRPLHQRIGHSPCLRAPSLEASQRPTPALPRGTPVTTRSATPQRPRGGPSRQVRERRTTTPVRHRWRPPRRYVPDKALLLMSTPLLAPSRGRPALRDPIPGPSLQGSDRTPQIARDRELEEQASRASRKRLAVEPASGRPSAIAYEPQTGLSGSCGALTESHPR